MLHAHASARYDLSQEIAGHDFYSWLVQVQAAGYRRIVFGIKPPLKETKWPEAQVLRRFRSIIEPGPALADLPYRIGPGGERDAASSHMRELVKWWNNGGRFKRLHSVSAPRFCRYTVTLRSDSRVTTSNSNRAAWLAFARKIDAQVIYDYEERPVPLHERMARYAGARMNFGVVNGPLYLLTLTNYPVTMFKCSVKGTASNLKKHGIPFGSQFPWAGAHQVNVWEDDTLFALLRHYETYHQRMV